MLLMVLFLDYFVGEVSEGEYIKNIGRGQKEKAPESNADRGLVRGCG